MDREYRNPRIGTLLCILGFHKWMLWKTLGKEAQQRQCIRCWKIERRYIEIEQ